jgi:alpha-L-arabinofuranosidase
MKNNILINPSRPTGSIDRNLFGSFVEHLGRCIYGGIYEPGSPLADGSGLRQDVMKALKRLKLTNIRYPGGNFVSGYRWMDGVGPKTDRPHRLDLAWQGIESNQFGTNEFVHFCRQLGAEPYFVVNCGDGEMREARDWVEYCNGTQDTTLVRLRKRHGYDAPHKVKYWGIGNEVDGPWQIGMKSPEEYARSFTEFGKVMKWVDPTISLIASATSTWASDYVERGQLLLEQASDLIDYMSIHWYVGNRENDFAAYMALSEFFEDRLTSYEGLIRAMRLSRQIKKQIPIAVDEWNVWYRGQPGIGNEEVYNLEDALVIGLQLNSFIRHASTVKMANIAQIVNVIAPILTTSEGLLLQSIFYPFELYSQNCGNTAIDVFWEGDTFSGGGCQGLRTLDVTASLEKKQISLFVINRSLDKAIEAEIRLTDGKITGAGKALVVNGNDIKAANTFDDPQKVTTREYTLAENGSSRVYVFEPHSVTCLQFQID